MIGSRLGSLVFCTVLTVVGCLLHINLSQYTSVLLWAEGLSGGNDIAELGEDLVLLRVFLTILLLVLM